MNDLHVEAYASGTTPISDLSGDMQKAENIEFDTYYQGGIFGPGSFDVHRDVVDWWALKGAQRLAIWNGNELAYESKVDDLEFLLEGSQQRVTVNLTGTWGAIAQRRRIHKRWADQRLTDDVWITQSEALGTITNAEKNQVNVNRETGLRFVPQSGEDWGNGEMFILRYSMPADASEVIKKIVFTWKFSEGAQAWAWGFYDLTNSVYLTNGGALYTATDVTGTVETITLSPTAAAVEFRLVSQAAQTTPADQSVHLYIYSMTVSSETSAINSTEIIKDLRAFLTELNASELLIASNTLDLTPFITANDGWEKCGDVMLRAAAFGDSSYNAWAVGLRDSESVATPDGKPPLFYEQQPALTDYDLAIRMSEMADRISIRRDYSKISNYTILQYKNDQGRTVYESPITDANLTDATSIAAYGQRDVPDKVLSYGEASQTMARNLARRFQAKAKDPQYNLSGPITVREYMRAKGGNLIPASMIRAGKRLLVEDYLDDLTVSGLTLLITGTHYDHNSRTCSITAGIPDDTASILAQIELNEKPGGWIFV